MKIKDAIKFGFGAAFGMYLFKLCNAFVDGAVEKSFRKKFEADPEFRIRVKTVSPDLYVKFRKESKEADTL